MPTDITQDITQQINSLNELIPKVNKLADLLAQPIISDEMIEEYKSIPPAQKEQWIKSQQPNINVDNINETEKLISELVPALSIIFGSDKIIQNLMSSQQQQKLQAAQKSNSQYTQKPAAPETAPVESLE